MCLQKHLRNSSNGKPAVFDALFVQPLKEEVAEQRANRSTLSPAEGNPVQDDKAENPSMTRIPLSKIK